jgi:Tfp pilus assembly protein PilF
MSVLSPRVSLRLLALLLLSCLPMIAGDNPWVEVRSGHFTVITDAGEKNGRHVADRFEQMRTIFGMLFGRAKINQPVPLVIIAFRNSKELRQYSPIFRGKVVEVAGFFQGGEDKDFIAVNIGEEDSWRTVFHEYAHVLLNANYQATAPWFDEGFAEYFSSMEVKPGNIELGQTVPAADFLMQGNHLHLLELFQVQHHSETYNVTGERREMFYVQSWLVVHYLLDNGRMGDSAKYFRLVNDQKMPVEQAIQAAYGVPAAELDKAILNYLKAGKLQVLHYSGKENIAVNYDATVRPLDAMEARAELADLHLHSQDYVKAATQEFEDIVKANPNNAEAQRGLGYAYLRSGDSEKAGEHFQAAAKLGSKDARVYFYSAVLLEKNGIHLGSPELEANLRRALELDPQYADAYAMLGVSLMSSGNSEEGGQDLRRAMELSPRNQSYRLNYAMALMNQQKVEEAEAVLTSVANGPDVAAADHAIEELKRIEEYKNRRVQLESSSSEASGPVIVARRSADSSANAMSSPEPAPQPQPAPAPQASPAVAKYLTGTLVSVDCSAPPSAVVSVSSGGHTWKMRVQDVEHAIVIGADKLSCDWSKKKVGINYRPTGTAEGSIISLELE